MELASRSAFSDDILNKSNVNTPTQKNPRLDPRRLARIKEILKQKLGDGVSDQDFKVLWTDAQTALQVKCKNLRSNACQTLTSSELLQMNESDIGMLR